MCLCYEPDEKHMFCGAGPNVLFRVQGPTTLLSVQTQVLSTESVGARHFTEGVKIHIDSIWED